MNEVEKILIEAGLNDREVKVYLATLELGQSTVLPISKQAGVKRTYCYDILADLQKRGLVSYFEQNNRRRYVAEDPKKLEHMLKERLDNISLVLPELRSIYNKSGEKPKVRYFEGKEGVLSIYRELATQKSFDAIASPQYIYRHLGKDFEALSKKIGASNTTIRELITGEGVGAEYIMDYKKPLQEARVLPDYVKISTDLLMYADKLAIISYAEHIHAVVIESKDIINTQKALFEVIWQQAKKI